MLVVDTNAVLTLATPRKLLESIGRRAAKVVDGMRIAQHPELSQGDRLNIAGQLPRELPIGDLLRFRVGKRLDHTQQDITRRVIRQPL